MIIQRIKTFIEGLVTSIDADSLARGASRSSLNWLTEGDKIEVRRGYRILGTENTDSGRATGIIKVVDAAKTDQLFGSFQKKVVHFNRTTEVFDEVGSDLLGDGVIQSDGFGENISFSEYVGLAGHQLWINSPNSSGLYKIMVANPGSAVDQYDSAKNYKGHISIDTNRMFLWGRNKDQTGLYGSYIDSLDYTTVSSEVLGTGDGVETNFTGTLAFKAGGAKRTCFAVSVTDGVETFTDDFNGNLTGDQGGTGTINYATGAIDVTFNSPVANLTNVLVDYQWEDSTDGGIADFTESATRVAGQGFVFRQDEGGGALQTVKNYKNIYYCFHTKKTWTLNLSNDDTQATNLPFRTLVGAPSLRGAVESDQGIYYIDDTTDNDPEIKLLQYGVNGLEEVTPVPKSAKLDLNNIDFSNAAGFRFGKYVLFTCKTSGAEVNNRVLVLNTELSAWDLVDYLAVDFAIYDQKLVAADSLSNNFTELFSGEDDDGSEIPNYWESGLDDNQITGLKKTKKFYIRGQIGPDQEIKVYLSFDNGGYIYVGNIEGGGNYVDRSQSVDVGALTLGQGEIGGGGDGRTAYEYERNFSIRTSKYERVSVKFEATKIGYASVSEYGYWDVRFKGQKVPRKYRG
jgi:hypothetical protein